LDGSALFVRSSLFKQVGGFDKLFGKGYGEDVDLGFKLLQQGFDLGCDSGTFYFHSGASSFGDRKARLLERGNATLRERWGALATNYLDYSERFWHAPYVRADPPSQDNPLPAKIRKLLEEEPL
jgi:GT2 family glycosyltransferase